MKKILVAIDGSEHSNRVLVQAKEIAEAFNAEVEIITVVIGMRNMYYYEGLHLVDDTQTGENYEKYANLIMDKALEVFMDYGKIERIVRYGDPATEIIKHIENNPFDLVVMGSKGLTGIGKLMIGSVSNKVLNNITVPILIVK